MTETILDLPTLTVVRHPTNIFLLTLRKPPENRLNSTYCQLLIRTFHQIQDLIGPSSPGAVITTSSSPKFFCTGLELDESDTNPFANSSGFYPLLATILDFPFPTIAAITGHTFGGACPFILAHDYRIMNADKGFISMPPVELGLHFPGIGALPRLKLGHRVARKMLLEAHRWTGKEAVGDGVVDEVVGLEGLEARALEVARRWAGKGRMGVYGLLRDELVGEAAEKLRSISYVRGRRVDREAKAKI
ncbi:enoyl-CoA hydratase/isomerase-like protein 1 [Elsinoe australis]|uniref:Enoyl-CoA hydratase/isomerase-like protein 1 n=1 Tax=Elsinoe australis TaxID=40998 RepID=A0A4U7BAY0_9PEZI|nr:enoyl-CoA hydratase/isomerase-like protein 1 [Elsinoe australis]